MRKIGKLVNKSHSTVHYIVNKFRYNGSTNHLKKKSKERKLNAREESLVVRQIKENPRLSALLNYEQKSKKQPLKQCSMRPSGVSYESMDTMGELHGKVIY